jgi:hypothetical protein
MLWCSGFIPDPDIVVLSVITLNASAAAKSASSRHFRD